MSSEPTFCRFADLFEVPQRNGLTRPKRVRGTGLPMVNMGELFAYKRIHDIPMDLVPFKDSENASLLRHKDLLFARQSLVLEGAGQCSIFLGHKKTVFESHLIRCRIDPNKGDPLFYYYFFSSRLGKDLIRQIVSQGAGASGIKASELVELQVPRPPKMLQKKIGQLMNAIDGEVETLERQNTALESLAQTLFRSWFVDFDPVHAKVLGEEPEAMLAELAELFPSEFEDSELGLIPQGWSIGRIGNIGQNPRAQGKPTEIPPTTPYVGLEHMPRRSLSITDWGSAATVESGKFWFNPSDILFGKLRPYFHKVGIASVKGVCSTDILVIRPKEPHWHAFLVMHLFSKAFIEHATQLSDGARMPRTNWSDTAAYKFASPPAELAERFNKLVQPMFSLMIANVNAIRSLASLRDHVLPRLISRKLHIEDAEASVAAITSVLETELEPV